MKLHALPYILVLATCAACAAGDDAPDDSVQTQDALSADFSVTFAGTTVPVTATDIADYASFAFTGKGRVKVTANRDVSSAVVKPLRRDPHEEHRLYELGAALSSSRGNE